MQPKRISRQATNNYRFLVIALLVAACAPKDEIGAQGRVSKKTPEITASELWAAVVAGDSVSAAKALAEGADARVTGQGGVTALMLAAADSRTGIAQLLIARGASLDAVRGTDSLTALMFASYFARRDVTDLLLSKGANLTLQDAGRRSVLDWAGQAPAVSIDSARAYGRYLRDKGATSKPKDAFGLFVSVGGAPNLAKMLDSARVRR